MKILFLDFDDIRNPLLGAGQARATFETGRRLVAKGHRVTVLSSRYPKCKDRTEQGIIYRHIGLGSHNLRLNNAIYPLALPLNIWRNQHVDIIVECFTAPISTLFTPLWTNKPVVAVPSSFDAERFSRKYHVPFHWIEKFGLRFYRYFLPLTIASDAKFKSVNPNVISRVVPEGVDTHFFSLKPKIPKQILFLGRLDLNQKGIDLLLCAYQKVQDKIKYPLIIAGCGPDETKIRRIVEELNLSTRVKMVGKTFELKKDRYLTSSLFVALPSRDETFSCFALEALASSLPIICFDIPGLSWIHSQVSLKAKPFDIDEYAQLLLKASEPTIRKNMSEAARKLASRYTWDSVADVYESFFFEILKRERE